MATVRQTRSLPVPGEVRRKVGTGQDLDRTITVGEYLQGWLAGRKNLREGTRRSYADHIRLYLYPTLGTIKLDRLRLGHVEAVFEAIDELNDTITRARDSGDLRLRARVKGRRLIGPATKQRVRATLRAALNKAIKQRLIEVNVAA
ncbi:hypothetical protein [Actinomadura macra]|uniref:hypothetical protein n=1 Tax=Actinomadura macra TaxID=46164 RepID=UPI00082C5DF4|nr:hypothetical protein [Actinomadura macra]